MKGSLTYFTNLHLEQKYGRDAMNEQLVKDRNRIIRFEENTKRPVVDTITTNLLQLLNPNSYQKGSWFLHMLRNKIGVDKFQSGIRKFYKEYKFGNAETADFIQIMSEVSEMNLIYFTNQWLRQDRMPEIELSINSKCKKSIYKISNLSKLEFDFPLEVSINLNGEKIFKTLKFNSKNSSYTFEYSKKDIVKIDLDPNVNLLFKESNKIIKRKIIISLRS